MESKPDSTYEFGAFRLEVRERRLLKSGKLVGIPPKVFDTLVVLVERRGRLVEKSELMAELWPSTVVGEISLARNISDLRKILEDGNGNRFIETVAKKGYRWVADIQVPVVRDVPARPPFHRSIAIILFAVAVVITIAGWVRWRIPEPSVNSIAVLPLRPLDADSHEESLEIGLTDSLITGLSASLDIPVRPTSSILRYAGSRFDSITAGRELKVDAVLDSSLLKMADRVRVTARLLRVRDGKALWAGSFEETREHLFRIQDAIMTQITPVLNPTRAVQPPVAVSRGPEYEDYLKGRYLWAQRTRAGISNAASYFERAISLNPSYSLAYAGLADAYIFEAGLSKTSHEMIPLARRAAQKAAELDPHLAEPHASLGLIAQNHELNWQKADLEYRKALELNPRYALAHHWYGEFLGHLGNFEESAREFERARELDPLSPAILNDRAKIDMFARDFEAALRHSREAIDLDPQFYLAHVFQSYALAKLGRCREALDEYQLARQLEDSAYVASTLVSIQVACGDRRGARASMTALIERSRREWISPFNIARAYASLGDATAAIQWFNKAIEDPDTDILSLKLAPQDDPVRDDPRFQELLHRLNLQ